MNVARNSEPHEAVLLLFPDGNTIIPVSTAAFSVAQDLGTNCPNLTSMLSFCFAQAKSRRL